MDYTEPVSAGVGVALLIELGVKISAVLTDELMPAGREAGADGCRNSITPNRRILIDCRQIESFRIVGQAALSPTLPYYDCATIVGRSARFSTINGRRDANAAEATT